MLTHAELAGRARQRLGDAYWTERGLKPLAADLELVHRFKLSREREGERERQLRRICSRAGIETSILDSTVDLQAKLQRSAPKGLLQELGTTIDMPNVGTRPRPPVPTGGVLRSSSAQQLTTARPQSALPSARPAVSPLAYDERPPSPSRTSTVSPERPSSAAPPTPHGLAAPPTQQFMFSRMIASTERLELELARALYGRDTRHHTHGCHSAWAPWPTPTPRGHPYTVSHPFIAPSLLRVSHMFSASKYFCAEGSSRVTRWSGARAHVVQALPPPHRIFATRGSRRRSFRRSGHTSPPSAPPRPNGYVHTPAAGMVLDADTLEGRPRFALSSPSMPASSSPVRHTVCTQVNTMDRLQALEGKLVEEGARARELTAQLRAREEELRAANDEVARLCACLHRCPTLWHPAAAPQGDQPVCGRAGESRVTRR
jgi:hypothetical protein